MVDLPAVARREGVGKGREGQVMVVDLGRWKEQA